jgi:hypothetical protein
MDIRRKSSFARIGSGTFSKGMIGQREEGQLVFFRPVKAVARLLSESSFYDKG